MDFSGPAGSQISKLMSAAWTRSRVLAANVTNQNTAGYIRRDVRFEEALLNELWRYATPPGSVWQQQWQPADLIIWDNRRVLHRRDDFDPQARRLMKRCQVLARSA